MQYKNRSSYFVIWTNCNVGSLWSGQHERLAELRYVEVVGTQKNTST